MTIGHCGQHIRTTVEGRILGGLLRRRPAGCAERQSKVICTLLQGESHSFATNDRPRRYFSITLLSSSTDGRSTSTALCASLTSPRSPLRASVTASCGKTQPAAVIEEDLGMYILIPPHTMRYASRRACTDRHSCTRTCARCVVT